MTVAHWRMPEFSHEQFISEFVDVYIPKFATLLHEHGITDFASVSNTNQPATKAPMAERTQFAPTKERGEQLKNVLPRWTDGFQCTDYDLLLEYIVPDLEVLKKISDDPRYAEFGEAGKKYITRQERIFSVGDYVPRIVKGELQ